MAHESSSGILAHWSTLIEQFQASPMEFYALVERAVGSRNIPEAGHCRVDYKEGGVLTARREYLRVMRGKHVFDICGAPFGSGFFVSSWLTETGPKYGWLYLIGIVTGLIAGSFMVIVLGLAAVANVVGFSAAMLLFFVVVPLALGVGPPLLFCIVGAIASRTELGIGEALLTIPFIGPLYEQIFQPRTYFKMDTALMFQKTVHAAILEGVDQLTSAKGVRALSEMDRKPLLLAF